MGMSTGYGYLSPTSQAKKNQIEQAC